MCGLTKWRINRVHILYLTIAHPYFHDKYDIHTYYFHVEFLSAESILQKIDINILESTLALDIEYAEQ